VLIALLLQHRLDARRERHSLVDRRVAAGDAEVEAFAAWLRQMRPKQQAAVAGKQDAEAATAEARAALAAARAAVRAVEELLEQHALAAEAEAERRAQGAIDEIAQHGEPIAQK